MKQNQHPSILVLAGGFLLAGAVMAVPNMSRAAGKPSEACFAGELEQRQLCDSACTSHFTHQQGHCETSHCREELGVTNEHLRQHKKSLRKKKQKVEHEYLNCLRQCQRSFYHDLGKCKE